VPIGNQGFWHRSGRRAIFDQQPLEAWATIEASLLALEITEDRRWFERADLALNWFYGRNALGALLVDPETGACADGLEMHGPSGNRGAESCLAYAGAQYLMEGASQSLKARHGRAALL